MKQFISNILWFSLPILLLYYIKPLYLLSEERYKQEVAGYETYAAIEKSKQKTNKTKLIIGDSVGYQLYPNNKENDSINSLACNQAIGLVGHFLLLNNYLKAGNRPKEVYLLYNPFSFDDNLNQVYTYHYFLKPFYTDEYTALFSESVQNQINKIPFHALSHEPSILTSNWAPTIDTTDIEPSFFISDISVDYIQKMVNLSHQYGFTFQIIPPPTRVSNQPKTERLKAALSNLNGSLTSLFKDYFNNIVYLNDTCFKDDVHLNNPNLSRPLIEEMMK